MGGPISATFTARFPERVRKLVLVDPAGAKPVTLARLLKAAAAPGVGELALGLFGSGRLAKGVQSDFYERANLKAFVAKYMLQMQYKGFMRALLATVRSGMLGDFSETYRQVGEQGTPTLLFWGRDDKTVPFSTAKTFAGQSHRLRCTPSTTAGTSRTTKNRTKPTRCCWSSCNEEKRNRHAYTVITPGPTPGSGMLRPG